MKYFLMMGAVVATLVGCSNDTRENETPEAAPDQVPPIKKLVIIDDLLVQQAINRFTMDRYGQSIHRPGVMVEEDVAAITELNFSLTKINDSGLKDVAKLHNLEVLSLASTPITDEGLKEVAKLQKLKHLSLLWISRITDEGLKEVAKLQNLETLDLPVETTDEGLREVVKLQSLKRLNLGRTRITDEGLKEVAKLQKLTKLYLFFADRVTKAGVVELQEALPNCQIDGP